MDGDGILFVISVSSMHLHTSKPIPCFPSSGTWRVRVQGLGLRV